MESLVVVLGCSCGYELKQENYSFLCFVSADESPSVPLIERDLWNQSFAPRSSVEPVLSVGTADLDVKYAEVGIELDDVAAVYDHALKQYVQKDNRAVGIVQGRQGFSDRNMQAYFAELLGFGTVLEMIMLSIIHVWLIGKSAEPSTSEASKIITEAEACLWTEELRSGNLPTTYAPGMNVCLFGAKPQPEYDTPATSNTGKRTKHCSI